MAINLTRHTPGHASKVGVGGITPLAPVDGAANDGKPSDLHMLATRGKGHHLPGQDRDVPSQVNNHKAMGRKESGGGHLTGGSI